MIVASTDSKRGSNGVYSLDSFHLNHPHNKAGSSAYWAAAAQPAATTKLSSVESEALWVSRSSAKAQRPLATDLQIRTGFPVLERPPTPPPKDSGRSTHRPSLPSSILSQVPPIDQVPQASADQTSPSKKRSSAAKAARTRITSLRSSKPRQADSDLEFSKAWRNSSDAAMATTKSSGGSATAGAWPIHNRPRGFSTSVTGAEQQLGGNLESLRPSTASADGQSSGLMHISSRTQPGSPGKRQSHRGLSHRKSALGRRTDASLKRDTVMPEDNVQITLKAALMAGSNYIGTSSNTERSSVSTKSSLKTESVVQDSTWSEEKDGLMSVDDAIRMYEEGFMDDPVEQDKDNSDVRISDERGHRRSRPVVTKWESAKTVKTASKTSESSPHLEKLAASRNDVPLESTSRHPPLTKSLSGPERDRYGFRKATQHVTLGQYDAWNLTYTDYLERRRRKWITLLKEHGLPTDHPVRFPQRSAKVKRFVRKGIPPEWRGAAWFWYAGGDALLSRHVGLYNDLVAKAGRGGMSKDDRDLIERDLNRTFPDNVLYRPDPTGYSASGDLYAQPTPEEETPIVKSLRYVLQAFSIHNPKIGYCQSLNFLAGLLLIFMDEEKAFWMLNIITHVYLPGTHQVNLEGANVDLAVLMASIRELLPAVWVKIGGDPDRSKAPPNTNAYNKIDRATATATKSFTRLPPVSLCTTAWFMSCFIGTLPMETVLRVWDSFFYEGSKTLFRIALTIFKLGEHEIRAINDPMEIFQVLPAIPRRLIDANALMEACFKRRGKFALTQQAVDERRKLWRAIYARERGFLAGDGARAQTQVGDGADEVASLGAGMDGLGARGGLRKRMNPFR